MPQGCDLVEAGALPVAFGTSHVALVHRANLSPGQVFLLVAQCSLTESLNRNLNFACSKPVK